MKKINLIIIWLVATLILSYPLFKIGYDLELFLIKVDTMNTWPGYYNFENNIAVNVRDDDIIVDIDTETLTKRFKRNDVYDEIDVIYITRPYILSVEAEHAVKQDPRVLDHIYLDKNNNFTLDSYGNKFVGVVYNDTDYRRNIISTGLKPYYLQTILFSEDKTIEDNQILKLEDYKLSNKILPFLLPLLCSYVLFILLFGWYIKPKHTAEQRKLYRKNNILLITIFICVILTSIITSLTIKIQQKNVKFNHYTSILNNITSKYDKNIKLTDLNLDIESFKNDLYKDYNMNVNIIDDIDNLPKSIENKISNSREFVAYIKCKDGEYYIDKIDDSNVVGIFIKDKVWSLNTIYIKPIIFKDIPADDYRILKSDDFIT